MGAVNRVRRHCMISRQHEGTPEVHRHKSKVRLVSVVYVSLQPRSVAQVQVEYSWKVGFNILDNIKYILHEIQLSGEIFW